MTRPASSGNRRPPVEWVESHPLTNTLRLPASAERLLRLDDLSEATLAAPAVADWLADPSTRVVAGGSNVVFATPTIARAVSVAADDWTASAAGDGRIDLSVEAGMGLDALVRETTARGWFGIEALAEIPGTVGAAPLQNVGAYGTEIADLARWVEAWDRRARRVVRFDREACGFAYRHSRFKREAGRWLILRLGLRLSTRKPADWPLMDYPGVKAAVDRWRRTTGRERAAMSPAEYADIIAAIRRAKLPDWRAGWPGSAGSFFHNPIVSEPLAERLVRRWPEMPRFPVDDGVKIPAGWLIEKAGLKGYRSGAVAISPRHALVLEHYGGATGAELLDFAEAVRRRVAEITGVVLTIEPECVGQR